MENQENMMLTMCTYNTKYPQINGKVGYFDINNNIFYIMNPKASLEIQNAEMEIGENGAFSFTTHNGNKYEFKSLELEKFKLLGDQTQETPYFSIKNVQFDFHNSTKEYGLSQLENKSGELIIDSERNMFFISEGKKWSLGEMTDTFRARKYSPDCISFETSFWNGQNAEFSIKTNKENEDLPNFCYKLDETFSAMINNTRELDNNHASEL